MCLCVCIRACVRARPCKRIKYSLLFLEKKGPYLAHPYPSSFLEGSLLLPNLTKKTNKSKLVYFIGGLMHNWMILIGD